MEKWEKIREKLQITISMRLKLLFDVISLGSTVSVSFGTDGRLVELVEAIALLVLNSVALTHAHTLTHTNAS